MAKSTYLYQSDHCSFVFSLSMRFRAACERSTRPIECGCFSVACFNLISSNSDSSCIKSDTKFEPKSEVIVCGRNECLKKIEVRAIATAFALPFTNGTANRYIENTSIPDSTYLYGAAGNGPTRSICSNSPGNDCSELKGCNGVFK